MLPHNNYRISLGKLSPLAYPLKQLAADSKFERKVVLFARLEPFIKLDLHRFEKRKTYGGR